MIEYNYSKELKKPLQTGDINFMDPKIQKSMKKVMKLFQFQAKMVHALPGTMKSHDFYVSFDGAMIPYIICEKKNTDRKLPAIIYYHGGGFMYPIQAMMVKNSLLYAKNTFCKVFLPEYRIAPENSCKVILEDAYSMLVHVYENASKLGVDKNNIIVYGDSAGGALAAAVTHMAKARKGPEIKAQMLIYPVTDNHSERYKSINEFSQAAWSKYANEQMWQIYLSHGDCGMMEYVAPLNHPDFKDMPKAYIEPQEIDILRDEAIAYGEKLKCAGNKVEINIIRGSYHGFDSDQKSSLVQRVMEKRYAVIRGMIS